MRDLIGLLFSFLVYVLILIVCDFGHVLPVATRGIALGLPALNPQG
jgi:hypothetical protein